MIDNQVDIYLLDTGNKFHTIQLCLKTRLSNTIYIADVFTFMVKVFRTLLGYLDLSFWGVFKVKRELGVNATYVVEFT